MANTPFADLYKWVKTHTKQQTIDGMALNADKIDTKLSEHASQLAETMQDLDQRGINITKSPYDVPMSGDVTLKLNDAISVLPSYSLIYLPIGNFTVSQLVIPSDKIGIKIVGAGKALTKLIFTSDVGISCQAEFVTFADITLEGNFSATSVLVSDDRNNNLADFDITFDNCTFLKAHTCVKSRGRGVRFLNDCLFSLWVAGGVIIDADFPETLVAGGTFQTKEEGFRAFSIKNCRFHYITATLFKNRGLNALNIKDIQIVDNHIEGSIRYYDGYARDLVFKGNEHIHYQRQVAHLAGFNFAGADNVNIDINYSSLTGDYGFDNIVRSIGVVNNLKLTGNVSGITEKVVYLLDGGTNINIDLNAENLSPTATHYVLLSKISTIFENYQSVNIKGRCTSNNVAFIGVESVSAITTINYAIDLIINGDYTWYSKGLNPLNCINQPTKNGVFVGDGLATKKIILKYKPRSVSIVGAQSGGTATYINSSLTGSSETVDIAVNEDGFTVSGLANASSTRYVYKAD